MITKEKLPMRTIFFRDHGITARKGERIMRLPDVSAGRPRMSDGQQGWKPRPAVRKAHAEPGGH
jgi:hypothetical protein